MDTAQEGATLVGAVRLCGQNGLVAPRRGGWVIKVWMQGPDPIIFNSMSKLLPELTTCRALSIPLSPFSHLLFGKPLLVSLLLARRLVPELAAANHDNK
jgi:hypothetical protein